MTSEQIAELIAEKEKCGVTSCRKHHATERFKDKVVWDGLVTEFHLKGHRTTSCLAWVDPETEELVTVLALPHVDSPTTAVSAYIASRK